MSLLSLLLGRRKPSRPVAVPWHRDPRGHYPRLLHLRTGEPDVAGLGGVYLLWHRGLEPAWIAVGASNDLGNTLVQLQDANQILDYEPHGGVYATWAPFKPQYRAGVVHYLREQLDPLIPGDPLTGDFGPKAEPVPVIPPQ